MKILKGFITFIIGIVLFVLIFSLSIVYRTKSFVEQELVVNTFKETMLSQMSEEKTPDDVKELVDKLANNKDVDQIIDRYVQNYLAYKTNTNYNISKEDYNIFLNFVLKYKDDFNKYSETKYEEEDIRKEMTYDAVNKLAKQTFEELEKELPDENFTKVITVYAETTSSNTKLILFLAILVCIILITLINWSFIKWLKVTGIDLIISGVIISGLYGLGLAAKKLVVAEETIATIIKNININGFIYMAAAEIVAGIVAIVIYKILKKKEV